MRVIDDTKERLLLGDLREERERQGRQKGQRRTALSPNTVASASRCGRGNRSRVIKHRLKLMEAAVGNSISDSTSGTRDVPGLARWDKYSSNALCQHLRRRVAR